MYTEHDYTELRFLQPLFPQSISKTDLPPTPQILTVTEAQQNTIHCVYS